MSNTAVFAFGRFNPPHIGHELVIQKVADTAENHGGTGYIFTSHTHDDSKNPLTWDEKIFFLERMFDYANIIKEKHVRTLFDAIAFLGNSGYNNVILVAGGDRIGKFRSQIKDSQLKEYGVDKFSVVNSGYRDNSSIGVQSASSSKQREYALNGNYESFAKSIPELDTRLKKKMFNIVRKRLTQK